MMMKTKLKKSVLYCMVFACLVCGIAAMLAGVHAEKAYAAQVIVEGSGDTFVYSDESYDSGETFAYVSTVHFENGNAAGLVFGGKEDDSCFVFNVDRAANRVKLMYFYNTDDGLKVEVLKEEYYVGSSIMNEGEQDYVKSRTANIDKVYLKVAVNDDGTAEFYADGIQRFVFTDGSELAEKIYINGFTLKDGTPVEYDGGLLGYNCFNAKVYFSDTLIGETDYGYYGELYRNQYHFSQFAHWNNDPNGLVYYNGYYHLYFQHNPYGNTWDAMHWGHARSKDLVHWEMLPIALVPDRDLSIDGEHDYGIGAMWSGSAMVYHKGDSAVIDSENWFDAGDKQTGDALGLIAYYTRFDNGGNRHQVLAYSDDGGLSWHKSKHIPSTVSLDLDGNPVNCGSWRDPKIFDISTLNGVGNYKWGMALTDMEDNTLFFLKSENLVNWEHAGSYKVYRPECPDVVTLTTDDDNKETHTVITFTSRYYVVCDLAYEGGNIVMKDPKTADTIKDLDIGSEYLQIMDYGVDSYAAQTFYIDENSDSKYNGKTVGLSWFSGVPNDDKSIESGVLQTARKVWNGGGMTVPVIYGLHETGGKYVLTTKPITAEEESGFDKTPLNGVEDVDGHCFEISATVQNDCGEPVYFRINGSADGTHYTEIGWNAQDGYYVDRTHTEDAGISFPQPNYACKYASGMGKINDTLEFYILSDNGGVEVYCDGFTVPFYILTFASPHSVKATFTADSSANAEITVNKIASVWRGDSDETLINLSETQVDLGVDLGQTRTVTAYAQGKTIDWEIIEGAEFIDVIPNSTGAEIIGKKAGAARIKASAGTSSRTIDVTVHSGSADSDFTFESSGIVSGNWYYSGNALIGEQAGGDGFLLANESGSDFTYTAQFDLGSGAAAALVFRATAENGKLTSYLIANYDNNSKIVKLWSQNGELGNVSAGNPDTKNLVLTAEASGKNIKVYLNGNKLIDCNIRDNDPASGKFGLNVCATRAAFSLITVQKSEYVYSGVGDLTIKSSVEQQALEIVNITLGNTSLSQGQYETSGRDIIIKQSYLELLPTSGEYSFAIYGSAFAFTVKVDVSSIPQTELTSVTVDEGINVTIWIGNSDVRFVKVNGTEIEQSLYKISGYTLTVMPAAFTVGANTVSINDTQSASVTVREVPKQTVLGTNDTPSTNGNIGLIVGLGVGIPVLVIAAAIFTVILFLRKKRSVKQTDTEHKE